MKRPVKPIAANPTSRPHEFGRRLWIGALLLLSPACTAPQRPLVVTDPDPSVKIPAIQKAVREKNRSVLPQLVNDLDSDDPAVRMYAIHALAQLTGEGFGYQYFADEDQREPSARKWREWLNHPQTAQAHEDPKMTHARLEP